MCVFVWECVQVRGLGLWEKQGYFLNFPLTFQLSLPKFLNMLSMEKICLAPCDFKFILTYATYKLYAVFYFYIVSVHILNVLKQF